MNKTISIVVENSSGVLARVSNLFSRRGFNIDSLAVGTTEDVKFSRITIVAACDERTLDQIVQQLAKLLCVRTVKVLNEEEKVQRDLVLVKVKAEAKERSEIVELVNIFRAKIIDVSSNTLTIEITGEGGKTSALLELLEQYVILELARTGTVALDRGSNTIYDNIDL